MDHSSINQWLGNVVSGGAIVASIVGYLPAFAAFVGLVWYLIQIYESTTVQRWIAGRRVRKIARMKAKVLMMEARAREAPLQLGKPDGGLPPGYD